MAPFACPDEVVARARRIRLIGFDVDGTLTDGRLVYGGDGQDAKAFHVQDGMGLVLLRESGIQVALVTARTSSEVERRGRELGLPHIHVGERGKLACMQRIAGQLGVGMDEVAFMGDDLPDLAAMRAAGLAIAPANVCPSLAPDVWSARPLFASSRWIAFTVMPAATSIGETRVCENSAAPALVIQLLGTAPIRR